MRTSFNGLKGVMHLYSLGGVQQVQVLCLGRHV